MIQIILTLFLIPSFLGAAIRPAETRSAAIQSPLQLFFKNQKDLNIPAQAVAKTAPAYDSLFGGLDAQIAIQYQDRWRTHEQNLPYRSSSWRGEYLTNSIQNGSPVYDWEARENFARQVLRMRVERGVREYLKRIKTSKIIARAENALESIRQVSVPVSSSSSKASGRFQFGYDVLSDSSKLEYVGGWVDMGFYKNGILSNIQDQSTALMQMSSEVSPELGRLSLSAPLSGTHVQTSLTKQLSQDITTSVSTQQSLRKNGEATYYWNMAFSF